MKIIGFDCGISNAGVCIIDCVAMTARAFTVNSTFKGSTSALTNIGKCREMHKKLRSIAALHQQDGPLLLAAEFPHGGSKSGAAATAMAMATAVTACVFNIKCDHRYAITPKQVKDFVVHNYKAITGMTWDFKQVPKGAVKAFAKCLARKTKLTLEDGQDHTADAVVVALLTASSLGLFDGLVQVPLGVEIAVIK